jgi:hypothetical protein
MRSLPTLAQPTTRRNPRMTDSLTLILRIVCTAALIEGAVITYISIEKWITRRRNR